MVLARRIARLGKPFPPAIITVNRVREQPTRWHRVEQPPTALGSRPYRELLSGKDYRVLRPRGGMSLGQAAHLRLHRCNRPQLCNRVTVCVRGFFACALPVQPSGVEQ